MFTSMKATWARRLALSVAVAVCGMVGSVDMDGVRTSAAAGEKAAGETLAVEKSRMHIQEVVSPGGIRAWLVEEHSVPLMSMRFAFSGGSAQDPTGKEGVANFLTAMLDEGAGDLDSAAFQDRMEDIAMRMSFQDGRDDFFGNFQTLTENRDAAADLLRLALTAPRFDASAVDRIRAQLLANLAFAEKNPNRVAGRVWAATVFPNHPYGHPATGTMESVAAIQSADLDAFRRRVFARNTLKIAVVGDIDATSLGLFLDTVFGGLAETSRLDKIPPVRISPDGKLGIVPLAVPQSVVLFGGQGIKRHDPDFMAAFVLNHIVGGGGFSSRLMEAVREKRGLAYGVYTHLQHFNAAELFAGQVATKNEKVSESLDVIKAELKRMAENGPSADELADAKSFLTGSYALRFDTSDKIASQLLGIQVDGLPKSYVDQRNGLVNAVTLDDVKRVAKRLYSDTDGLYITVVGQPKNLVASDGHVSR